MTTARNAPCPCGSGKKFKRCCGAAGAVDVTAAGADAVDHEPSAQSRLADRSLMLPVVLFGSAVGIGVAVGTLRGGVADGLAVSLALILAVMIYLMARNPPEGTGTGGGTAINYGMGGRKRRNTGRQSRSQRRRK